jgi:hypothetical protein
MVSAWAPTASATSSSRAAIAMFLAILKVDQTLAGMQRRERSSTEGFREDAQRVNNSHNLAHCWDRG